MDKTVYKIAVIPGDGIGPEVIGEGMRVLEKVAELDGSFRFAFTHTSVHGILNFTPARLNVSENIRIHHIDLAVELQTLVYFLKNYPQ